MRGLVEVCLSITFENLAYTEYCDACLSADIKPANLDSLAHAQKCEAGGASWPWWGEARRPYLFSTMARRQRSKHLAKKLRVIRKRLGLSQSQLAARLELASSARQ